MINRIENIFCSILRDSLLEQEFSAIRTMSSSDWSSIYEIALHNNLLPLLYYKLINHKILVSSDLKLKLRDNYLASSRKDFQRNKQLCELIKIFNDNRIDHILLKGSHLAEKVYYNSVLRPMCDIDVLIRESDFSKAFEELEKYGYKSSKNDNHDTKYFALNQHYPELIKDGYFPVELHWNINRNYEYKNIEKLWSRAEKTEIGNFNTRVLSSEDLLMHICVHKGCMDNYVSAILMLNDIKEILAPCSINWQKLAEIAFSQDDWGNTKCIFSALYLSRKLLGTKPSESFLESVKPNNFNVEDEDLLVKQFFTFNSSDLITKGVATAMNKIHNNFSYKIVLQYIMSPKSLCVRYNTKYSLKILPYLYCKRIIQKSIHAINLICCLLYKNDIRSLYSASKASEKVNKWLKS